VKSRHKTERDRKRLTIEHHPRSLGDLGHVPRLLPQLANGCLFRRLALVDQAGRDLDTDLVNRRSELLLKHDLGAKQQGLANISQPTSDVVIECKRGQ